MPTAPAPAAARCAAHPGRPAVDDCPACGRPRCGADRAATAGGCAVCRTGAAGAAPVRREPGETELLVRAALAASLVSVAWGFVQAEYVQADLFQFLSPAVLGVLSGGTATAAARHPRGRLGQRVRLVAAGYAVLGCAVGFVLEGTFSALSTSVDVLLPYLIAAAAAWVYTAPPKARAASVRASSDG